MVTTRKPSRRLKCYASGSGALDFQWVGKTGEDAGQALGTPKMHEVRRFMRGAEGRRLAGNGWKLVVINGFPVLWHVVERVGPNTLRLTGKDAGEFNYTLKTPIEPGDDSQQIAWKVTFTFDHEIFGRRELVNHSIRSALTFFLANEWRLATDLILTY